MLPLILFGASAAANLYTQANSRRLYGAYKKSYEALDKGYSAHLARFGIKRMNPNRRMLSYYGQAMSHRTNLANSYVGSFGTAAGSIGAGYALSSRWL